MVQREESFYSQVPAAENFFIHLRAEFFKVRKFICHTRLPYQSCESTEPILCAKMNERRQFGLAESSERCVHAPPQCHDVHQNQTWMTSCEPRRSSPT